MSAPRRRDPVRRERVITAMTEVVAERGYRHTTIRAVAARAGVSTATFYALFDGLDDCFAEVLSLGLRAPLQLIAGAIHGQPRWQDAVRDALEVLLVYFDREPLLTRMWFIDGWSAGPWMLERREQHVRVIAEAIVAQAVPAGTPAPDPQVAVGVINALLGAIQAHVVSERQEPLISLLGPLTGLMVRPFLRADRAAREIALADARAREILTGERAAPAGPLPVLPDPPPLPRRTVECLGFLAANPGASNRQVADALSIRHRSQVSTLLSGLEHSGLLEKVAARPGHAHAWSLTASGWRALHGPRIEGPHAG